MVADLGRGLAACGGGPPAVVATAVSDADALVVGGSKGPASNTPTSGSRAAEGTCADIDRLAG